VKAAALHFLRGLPRVVLVMVAATAAMWVAVRVIPDSSRVSRLPISDALDEWVEWFVATLRGDLGFSRGYSESVNDGVRRTVPITLQLALYAQVISLALSVPLALLATRWSKTAVDRGISTGSLVLLSLPPIVIAPLLIAILALGGVAIGGTQLGVEWFPTGRYTPLGESAFEHVRSMTLPTLALAAGLVAPYVVVLRNELLTVASQDFIQAALARGMPRRRVLLRHALPVGLPRLVAVAAAQTAVLIGNLVIIERLFLMPGFTDYVLVAIERRDLPPLAGGTAIIAGTLATVNLLADSVIVGLDPRRADVNPRISWAGPPRPPGWPRRRASDRSASP
jgi:peptide/nickel transport system permease protein